MAPPCPCLRLWAEFRSCATGTLTPPPSHRRDQGPVLCVLKLYEKIHSQNPLKFPFCERLELSLDHVEIFRAVEDELGLEISDTDLEEVHTPNEALPSPSQTRKGYTSTRRAPLSPRGDSGGPGGVWIEDGFRYHR